VFSPDGALIVTASRDSTARIWNAASGQQIAEPLRHRASLTSAEFSPDGVRIVTASADCTARIWDAASGQQIGNPRRHEDVVVSAAFSPDGARIVTASDDYSARIWDADSGPTQKGDVLRLRRLVLAIGGRKTKEDGPLEEVPAEEFNDSRRYLDTISRAEHMLHWWWSDPFTRNIQPSTPIAVPEFVRRRVREVLAGNDDVGKSALADARVAFPHHPLVLLLLAESGQHGDPDWLANYASSRLLAEPHYLVPLPAPLDDDERAARSRELHGGLAEDCYLGARILQRQGRIELGKEVLTRALRLLPEHVEARRLHDELAVPVPLA
jgi:hypothetical protein